MKYSNEQVNTLTSHTRASIQLTLLHKAADVKFKKVMAVAVWNIEGTKISYWFLYTKTGYYLGKVSHLDYIREANEI